MLNTLLHMEFMKEGRNIRLPVLMIFYNSILAFITILFIFFHNESMQAGYYTGRSSFLAQFLVISSFQILSIFFVMPFSVSFLQENEKGAQKLFSAIPGVLGKYVLAKVFVIICANLLLFVSSLPIISLSCIYSGISLFKMCRLFGVILVFSFWCGSIAVFCQSINRRVIFGFAGTIFAYIMFSFGIIMILEIIRGVNLSFSSTGEISQGVTFLCLVLNLFNPITTYVGYYGNLTGSVGILQSYLGNFGIDTTGTIFSFLYYKAATLVCVLVGILFIYYSVRIFEHKN